jgi:hypothetical protein
MAVDLYGKLLTQHQWNASTAWHGIALLLLSCETWDRKWRPFEDFVIYREINDLRPGKNNIAGAARTRAKRLSALLADELRIPRQNLCTTIGAYWREPTISSSQPNNLVGHAFRSLTVAILQRFGAPEISYTEEVDPRQEFPGFEFKTRSRKPRLDIVARKGPKIAALISTRWRFRHDRVDVVEEALAYAVAARRQNAQCGIYAVLGEFSPNRLDKVLSHCPPVHPNPVLSATIHFAPALITEGLGANGRLHHLKSLEWLIDQTYTW